MPILKGTMSYTRFMAPGEEYSAEQIVERLGLFKFRPLHERGEDKESAGWSSYLSEYDHEKKIEISDFLYGEKIILAMRIDTLALPNQYLKARIKKSLIEYQREHNQKADKRTKKEIESAEIQALRSRLMPKTRITEALWCQKSQELRIFSRSASVIDRFTELFQETFLIRPSQRDFTHEAFWQAQSMQNLSKLEDLTHEALFMPPVRIDVQ